MFENRADATHTITITVVEVDFVDDDVISEKKKEKKKMFENRDDTTHTITIPVVEIDFVDDDVISEKKKKKKKKKKNFLKYCLFKY
jgi:4-diphosphocytidyl-2C-methyl-D-erythritol kinase